MHHHTHVNIRGHVLTTMKKFTNDDISGNCQQEGIQI